MLLTIPGENSHPVKTTATLKNTFIIATESTVNVLYATFVDSYCNEKDLLSCNNFSVNLAALSKIV